MFSTAATVEDSVAAEEGLPRVQGTESHERNTQASGSHLIQTRTVEPNSKSTSGASSILISPIHWSKCSQATSLPAAHSTLGKRPAEGLPELENEGGSEPLKRGRGRPKGSKNKNTLEKERLEALATLGIGRPDSSQRPQKTQ
jgi:hypothetical protein